MQENKEWFASWFDSEYYHKLYDHRNEEEAVGFIDHLISRLNIPDTSRILDLACGKGRHSRYLFERNMDVTGVDLSPESIGFASQWEQDRLEFYVHDMRYPFRINYYDYIFNLFTSFGYFNTENEHIKVLRSAYNGLTKKGVFVMDFLNETYVAKRLVSEERVTKGDLIFHIKRKIENGFIIKNIRFNIEGREEQFEERVRAFKKDELKDLFKQVGFQIKSYFGNYNLDKFDLIDSPRLILVGIK